MVNENKTQSLFWPFIWGFAFLVILIFNVTVVSAQPLSEQEHYYYNAFPDENGNEPMVAIFQPVVQGNLSYGYSFYKFLPYHEVYEEDAYTFTDNPFIRVLIMDAMVPVYADATQLRDYFLALIPDGQYYSPAIRVPLPPDMTISYVPSSSGVHLAQYAWKISPVIYRASTYHSISLYIRPETGLSHYPTVGSDYFELYYGYGASNIGTLRFRINGTYTGSGLVPVAPTPRPDPWNYVGYDNFAGVTAPALDPDGTFNLSTFSSLPFSALVGEFPGVINYLFDLTWSQFWFLWVILYAEIIIGLLAFIAGIGRLFSSVTNGIGNKKSGGEG